MMCTVVNSGDFRIRIALGQPFSNNRNIIFIATIDY